MDLKKDDKWLLSHNNEHYPWLPFKKYNYLVPTLRDFFKEDNIDNRFKGSIEVSIAELKSLALDIVSFSSVLEYIDINVSSLCDPVVFKLCGHGDINIISHDKKMISFLLEQIKIDVKYKVVIY